MAEPFAAPREPQPDDVVSHLERGSRARQLLQLGTGADLGRRRMAIWRQAEHELLAGTLTADRALLHVACSNALRAYHDELRSDMRTAERVAERLHAEIEDANDGAA